MTGLKEEIESAVSGFKSLLVKANMEEKPHQIEGVKWCVWNELTLNKGGLIADEMGLGKTLQMLGVINAREVLNTLIVVPLALLNQWEQAVINILGKAPLVYHGNNKRRIDDTKLSEASIVITTYGEITLLKGKVREIHKISWKRVCFDEAHHLRNSKTGMHKGAMALKCPIRWLMTGTPI